MAWSGGRSGMTLTRSLICSLPVRLQSIPRQCSSKTVLNRRGRCYLVAIEQNDPAAIAEYASSLGLDCYVGVNGYGGLNVQNALRRRAGGEIIYVLCLTRRGRGEGTKGSA